MNIERKFALHYPTVNEIDAIDRALLNLGCDICEYIFDLRFDNERINTSSKEEFISIIKLKSVNPVDFTFRIYGKKAYKAKEKLSFEYSEKIYSICLMTFSSLKFLGVTVEAPEVDKAYSILSKIEQILSLKKREDLSAVQTKKEKSVFIAHSFDKKGKAYGQTLGKFLTL